MSSWPPPFCYVSLPLPFPAGDMDREPVLPACALCPRVSRGCLHPADRTLGAPPTPASLLRRGTSVAPRLPLPLGPRHPGPHAHEHLLRAPDPCMPSPRPWPPLLTRPLLVVRRPRQPEQCGHGNVDLQGDLLSSPAEPNSDIQLHGLTVTFFVLVRGGDKDE